MSNKNKQIGQNSSKWAEYFWANVIFWSFLLLVVFFIWNGAASEQDDQAIKLVLKDTRNFILLLFGGGFTLVTLFDAAYDFFAASADQAKADAGSGNSGA